MPDAIMRPDDYLRCTGVLREFEVLEGSGTAV
jgi:hypothetical protein